MRGKVSIVVITWTVAFLQVYCACSHIDQAAINQKQISFTEYLNAMTTNYIELKDALVNDNRSQVAKEADEFLAYLQEIDDSSLDAKARQQWINRKLELTNILDQQSDTVDLESQRHMFSDLTSKMEMLIDQFGPVEQTLYKQYCPQALDGEGAYWLNEKKEILNPYGGRGQLHCGEIVEVIKGRD